MSSYDLTVTIAVAFLAVMVVGGILAMIGLTWAALREDAALRKADHRPGSGGLGDE